MAEHRLISSEIVTAPGRAEKRATVITDASYDWNHRVGGWAAWIRYDGDRGPLCRSGVIKGRPPNSTHAEVMAALNGIWLATTFSGASSILLQTDCMAVLHLVDKTTRAPDLLKLWNEAFTLPALNGLTITARHVKGHGRVHDARTYVNDWCDKYAKQHMREARSNVGRHRG